MPPLTWKAMVAFVGMLFLSAFPRSHAMLEGDRLREYERRNYTWPPQKFIPDTPGWRALMLDRFEQIQRLEKSGDRYEGYLQAVHSALLAPNFTELGFGLTRAPDDLVSALRQGIRDGLAAGPREEGTVDVIGGPHKPWFIDRPDLTERVLHELQPYAEAWSEQALVPQQAYGLRGYKSESSLWMHADRPETHIISIILHIDSSEDAQPWPIFIEDFLGRTHEVTLTSGDILFYESSKCFHGRPRPLNGSWYSSIFVHYYPVGWNEVSHKLEAHYAVPPRWNQDPVATPSTSSEEPDPEDGSSDRAAGKRHDRLQMAGTSMLHPDCPDYWCPAKDAIAWSGPGEAGYWIAPDFRKFPLDLSTSPTWQRRMQETKAGGGEL